MSSRSKQSGRDAGRKPGKALRRALLEHWPEARVLDEALVLDGARFADLALEADGILWLVLRAKRLDAAAVQLVRHTLDRARRLGPLVARGLGGDACEVRVMLVVKHLLEDGRVALADELDAGLVLVRRHRVRGTETSRLFLERIDGDLPPTATPRDAEAAPAERATPPPVAGLPPGPARFVASLAPDRAPLAAELIRRQLRLDAELACEGDEHGLVWLRAEEVLCSLHSGSDGLECRLAGIGIPRVLHGPADLEDWLDFLLAQYFERWPAGEGPEPSFEIPRPEAGGGWLSEAEFEAFRDAPEGPGA